MEHILDLYELPYNALRPMVCFDETCNSDEEYEFFAQSFPCDTLKIVSGLRMCYIGFRPHFANFGGPNAIHRPTQDRFSSPADHEYALAPH
jgi:hypothetical protein